MRKTIVSVASAIAVFPTHPPEDFKFLDNTSIVYKPCMIYVICSLKQNATCISFDFAIKASQQQSAWHGYQWCVEKGG